MGDFPRSRSASLSSVGSAALPTFEGIAPPRPPTTTVDAESHIAVPGTPGVRLKVDAGPGCGGIAWPAGEVSRMLPDRAVHPSGGLITA